MCWPWARSISVKAEAPELGHTSRKKRRARPCPQGAQSRAGEVRQGLCTNISQAEPSNFLTVLKHACPFLALCLLLPPPPPPPPKNKTKKPLQLLENKFVVRAYVLKSVMNSLRAGTIFHSLFLAEVLAQ